MIGAVLVTGASGFVGRAVARRLAEDGREVVGLDLAAPVCAHPRYRHAVADLLDEPALARALSGVQAVVHTAAIVGMDACARDPFLALRVNVLGTLRLAERFAAAGGRRFVHLSTQEVYGHFTHQPAPESHEAAPIALYGLSKQIAEAQLRGSGLEVVNLRGAWIYGPGMAAWKIPAWVVSQARRDGRIAFPEGRDSMMDLVHVDDVAGLVARVLDADLAGVADFNAASGQAVSFEQLCQLVAARCGGVPVTVGPGRLRTAGGSEVARQGALDQSRVRALLGFRAAIALEPGLDALVGAMTRAIG